CIFIFTKKWIFAIKLGNSGKLAENYQFSSYPNQHNSKIRLRQDSLVTIDRNYISARNAASSADFAFVVIEKLGSKELAQKIRNGFYL
ncbi:DJ-1 family protein, partial [Mesomycoplasma hyopneumoniae]